MGINKPPSAVPALVLTSFAAGDGGLSKSESNWLGFHPSQLLY